MSKTGELLRKIDESSVPNSDTGTRYVINSGQDYVSEYKPDSNTTIGQGVPTGDIATEINGSEYSPGGPISASDMRRAVGYNGVKVRHQSGNNEARPTEYKTESNLRSGFRDKRRPNK